jgi:hypothetical protein
MQLSHRQLVLTRLFSLHSYKYYIFAFRETLGTRYFYQPGICAASFQGAVFELRLFLLVHLSLPYPQQEGRISDYVPSAGVVILD